jgi:hypothetical protein
MDMLEVEIFPDSLVPHLYQIYAGLYELSATRKLRIVVSSQQVVPGDKHSLILVVRDKSTGKERKICFDMGDGCRILPIQRLEACDIFFKRSYLETIYQHLPEPQRKKIIPFGLNWGPMLGCGLVSKFRLALASLRIGRVSAEGTNDRLDRAKELSKLFTSSSPFTFMDKNPYVTSDAFEAGANAPASPRIIFQTRAWEHRYDAGDGPKFLVLNEQRANIVRALRKSFGDTFVGGMTPDEYTREFYPDCLTTNATDLATYSTNMKGCLIGVSTIGLHGSTPWKLPEYLAASRCIVMERLNYRLPAILEENVNFIPFVTPEECVRACEKILSDPDLAMRMRQANAQYYKNEVRSDALLWRCLQTALNSPPAEC